MLEKSAVVFLVLVVYCAFASAGSGPSKPADTGQSNSDPQQPLNPNSIQQDVQVIKDQLVDVQRATSGQQPQTCVEIKPGSSLSAQVPAQPPQDPMPVHSQNKTSESATVSQTFDDLLDEIALLIRDDVGSGRTINAKSFLEKTHPKYESLSYIEQLSLQRDYTSQAVEKKLAQLALLAKAENKDIIESISGERKMGGHYPIPLFISAIRHGLTGTVRAMLDLGVDPNRPVRWTHDFSPMYFAITDVTHADLVKELLRKGVDPNHADVTRKPPLYWALLGRKNDVGQFKKGNPKAAKLLLDSGAQMDSAFAAFDTVDIEQGKDPRLSDRNLAIRACARTLHDLGMDRQVIIDLMIKNIPKLSKHSNAADLLAMYLATLAEW